MKRKETIWTFNFISLFVTNSVLFLGQFMLTTLLPKYLSALGYGTSIIGVVVGMFSITALGTRPVTGPLIDGVNRKILYMAMLILMAIVSFGYAIFSSVPMIILFRLLHGIGMGCNAALALTMATDELPADKMASGIGIYGLSNVIASAIGPGVGLAVADRFSYQTAFVFSGILLLVSLLLASRMKISNDPSRRVVFKLENMIAKQALFPALMMALICFARAGIVTYLVLYITEYRHISGITAYYVINAVVMVISRPLFGRLSDKKGFRVSLAPAYILFAANLILLAVCTQTWQLWLCAVLNAVGYGNALSAHQAITMKVVPAKYRGAGSTTNFIGVDCGDLIGPIIFGAIVTQFGYECMFVASLVPLVLCAVCTYVWIAVKHGISEAR